MLSQSLISAPYALLSTPYCDCTAVLVRLPCDTSAYILYFSKIFIPLLRKWVGCEIYSHDRSFHGILSAPKQSICGGTDSDTSGRLFRCMVWLRVRGIHYIVWKGVYWRFVVDTGKIRNLICIKNLHKVSNRCLRVWRSYSTLPVLGGADCHIGVGFIVVYSFW